MEHGISFDKGISHTRMQDKQRMLNTLRTVLFAPQTAQQEKNQADKGLITYAILSAAKNEQLWMQLQACSPEYRCLYNGADTIALAEVAPYLVKLEPRHAFTEWALHHCYGDHCGGFLHSEQDIDSLAEHYMHYARTIAFIGGQDREVYFNFYDPRVFPGYIKTRTKEKFQQFFKSIHCWWTEDEDDPHSLHRYSTADKGWQVEIFSLRDRESEHE